MGQRYTSWPWAFVLAEGKHADTMAPRQKEEPALGGRLGPSFGGLVLHIMPEVSAALGRLLPDKEQLLAILNRMRDQLEDPNSVTRYPAAPRSR